MGNKCGACLSNNEDISDISKSIPRKNGGSRMQSIASVQTIGRTGTSVSSENLHTF